MLSGEVVYDGQVWFAARQESSAHFFVASCQHN